MRPARGRSDVFKPKWRKSPRWFAFCRAVPPWPTSDEKTEVDRGIALFTVALLQLPQVDSIYVAYGNGSFLQVRRVAGLNDEQRATLRAPANAAISISLIRPTSDGSLPMRRIFEDQQGNQIEQLDLWKYGYDARKRRWYLDTIEGDQPVISSPYISFSIGAPVITVSAPLRGTVRESSPQISSSTASATSSTRSGPERVERP